ncbi:hypothetical protein AB6N01_01180 [Alcaligenes nematophilus]|uniref:hypothetical protein n=1 Tax=Alcaligenes nematophilus TaxID=2994643 RepID=UPI0034E099E6
MLSSLILSGAISSFAVLGLDPHIAPPWLEPEPTAESVVSPFSNLLPDFRDYQVQLIHGVCPTPSLSIFNQSFVMDLHCAMFDENKTLIQLAMVLSFSFSSLLIVLRA